VSVRFVSQVQGKKPLRLIELFAGYGSQALALENLGVEFEHYLAVEFDKYAIASYNALHGTNFKTQDITQLKDLNVVETNIYDYIVTYSFPCTDLSLAGKRGGMSRDSETRSSLLWEVERLLSSSKELPQILIMENVTAIHSVKFNEDFKVWLDFLTSLGYSNQWQDLNAKDFGIPQNRDRTFLVSILGDYQYEFPKPKELEIKLKDLLEEEVDDKFFLSDKMVKVLSLVTEKYDRQKDFKPHEEPYETIAKTVTTRAGSRPPDNYIKIPEATIKGYSEAYEGDGIYINRPYQKRGVVQKQMIQTIKTSIDDIAVVTKNLKIRKLTPREIFRLMGLNDNQIDKLINLHSNTQLYKQAGNSIVVQVLENIFRELLKDE
jgi:DNA (cytosine-5)-methyltransferase 1